MKKAYAFLVDAGIAALILLTGLYIVMQGQRTVDKPDFMAKQLSEDIVGVMLNTQVRDLCDIETCECPRYANLSQMVCNEFIYNKDTDLLSLISQAIQSGTIEGRVIEDLIHDIFVKKKLINENKNGFSIMYQDPSGSTPIEIYNTEKYEAG